MWHPQVQMSLPQFLIRPASTSTNMNFISANKAGFQKCKRDLVKSTGKSFNM